MPFCGVPALPAATLDEFLAALAARTPTPGGGSVAALCGAAGAALGQMAARFTTGKRYAERAAAMERLAAELEPATRSLAAAVERDARAYDAVSAALRLPQDALEQRAERERALRAATLSAMDVPLEVLERAVEALEKLAPAAEEGFNRNLASDVAVCALALHCCAEGAFRNLAVNAAALPGDAGAAGRMERGRALRAVAGELAERVRRAGDRALGLEES